MSDLADALALLQGLSERSPVEDYLTPFALHPDEPFICFHDFLPNKQELVDRYTRSEFWQLVMRCAAVLSSVGLAKGDCHVHYFSGNSVVDLAMRTASVVLGTVPVTVNWQADTLELVAYKTEVTAAKLVVSDGRTPADHLSALKSLFPSCAFVTAADIVSTPPHSDLSALLAGRPLVTAEDTRCIIFTSGTTGKPKGVELSYGNYSTNRSTFERFLQLTDPAVPFCPLCVNPMHHTNSTSITDWSLRRPGTLLHLVDHYTTQYWNILVGVHSDALRVGNGNAEAGERPVKSARVQRRVVAPLVSRHIDFLETLYTAERPSININLAELSSCLENTVLLLGSAPVGPTTVSRLLEYAHRLPTVRFGSTETTLQVCGIPLHLSQDAVVACFKRGWDHTRADGSACQGFYIGREHAPFTEVDIVRSVVRGEEGYMQPCTAGVPGYIVTRGGHIFRSYVGLPKEVSEVAKSDDGWYLNLGDIGFWLPSAEDGQLQYAKSKDLYWQSRDSQMLIRGGANYAFEQVNAELSAFVTRHFHLPPSAFSLAVCGIRVLSEHEDECCVMLQLHPAEIPAACGAVGSIFNSTTEEIVAAGGALQHAVEDTLKQSFLRHANATTSGITKGAKPNRFAIGEIPMVASKGVVNVPLLVKHWKAVAAQDIMQSS